jgi:hypothetical protein
MRTAASSDLAVWSVIRGRTFPSLPHSIPVYYLHDSLPPAAQLVWSANTDSMTVEPNPAFRLGPRPVSSTFHLVTLIQVKGKVVPVFNELSTTP